MEKFIQLVRRFPGIFLFILAPVFGLLLSLNISLGGFASLPNLVYLVFPIGFGALICREASVRWNSGSRGLFFLALAFGIFITILVKRGVFDSTYAADDAELLKYDFVWNINWAEMTQSIFYTALMGVLVPVKFTEILAGERASEPWLNKPVTGIAIGSLAGILTVSWFQIELKTPVLPVLIAAALVLTLGALAYSLKKKDTEPAEMPVKKYGSAFFLGLLSTLFPWIFLAFMSGISYGPVNFLIVAAVELLVLFLIIRRTGGLINCSSLTKFYFISGTVLFALALLPLYDLLEFQGNIFVSVVIFIFFFLVHTQIKNEIE